MKVIARNKRAKYDYIWLSQYQAGISLLGSEVKALRAGGISLGGSYIKEKNEELFLVDFNIPATDTSFFQAHEPTRDRKLLLHKKEIKKIKASIAQKSLAVIPVSIFFDKRGFVKLDIVLGKGKKKFDKRQALKKDFDKKEVNNG